MQSSINREFLKGLWNEHPTLRLLIGMCPTLAVTTAAINGFGMGLSVIFVLVCSSVLISLLRNFIPNQVRIPCFIMVIATFTTIIDMVLAAYFPALHEVLGLFIPLIVVNCIILGRAEAYASKHSPLYAFIDALGMGLGVTWGLTFIGAIREIMGMGTVFGLPVFPETATSWIIFILPPGAFFTLGIAVGAMNHINYVIERRKRQQVSRPAAAGQAVQG
ncbi:MAG TPA: electron transport complex subunit E [Firmicutes bacterium]|nr:electron transport complex subunit E [Bacillota bacterium]